MRKTDIVIFLLFAFMASWQDIRYRGVAVWLFAIFAGIALINGFAEGRMPAGLYGTFAGFTLLLISRLTRGAIGSGDAWFFIVSGLMLPPSYVFGMFCAALFLSGIFSLVVIVARRIKSGRNAGTDTFPFIPFAAAAGTLIMITGMV